MKVKAICQICGKVEVIDTEKRTSWRTYRLGDFDFEWLPGWWENFEIWICGDCLETVKEHFGRVVCKDGIIYDYRDFGAYYALPFIRKLAVVVEKSLGEG